jgi:hypothetical protein
LKKRVKAERCVGAVRADNDPRRIFFRPALFD